jgi:hypothetical protein
MLQCHWSAAQNAFPRIWVVGDGLLEKLALQTPLLGAQHLPRDNPLPTPLDPVPYRYGSWF